MLTQMVHRLKQSILVLSSPLWGGVLLLYGMGVGMISSLQDVITYLGTWHQRERHYLSQHRAGKRTYLSGNRLKRPMTLGEEVAVGAMVLPLFVAIGLVRGVLLGPYRTYKIWYRRSTVWLSRSSLW